MPRIGVPVYIICIGLKPCFRRPLEGTRDHLWATVARLCEILEIFEDFFLFNINLRGNLGLWRQIITVFVGPQPEETD